MFSIGDDNPLQFHPSFKKPPFQLYDQIQTPIISQHDHDSPFFSNFPSPFFDEHELLPLSQIFPNFNCNPAPSSSDHTQKLLQKDPPKLKHMKTAAAPPRRRGLAVTTGATAAPRKRTGKKDRHSKICTAQGIRDRRMRLSLQVARKFFDLQDLLGYDKASKTIEWLFSKSKKEIKELAKDVSVRGGGSNVSLGDARSESFVSECEVVSGIEENCSNYEVKGEGSLMAAEEDDKSGSFEKKPRTSAYKPKTRESREKARAKARCRTEEKMMGKLRVGGPIPNSNDLEKLGSSTNIPFNSGGDDDQERVPAFDAGNYSPLLQLQLPSDVGTIEKLLGSSSSDFPNTNFMGFLGNWDLSSSERLDTSFQASMAAGNLNSIYSATAPDFLLFHQ